MNKRVQIQARNKQIRGMVALVGRKNSAQDPNNKMSNLKEKAMKSPSQSIWKRKLGFKGLFGLLRAHPNNKRWFPKCKNVSKVTQSVPKLPENLLNLPKMCKTFTRLDVFFYSFYLLRTFFGFRGGRQTPFEA